jgi:2-amino-4-hydroxy-6-hydroxymethyldihydropteridine diphosphokinase
MQKDSANTVVYIALGSNLGERQDNIDKAVAEIKKCYGIEVLRQSSVVETRPLAGSGGEDYLNCVIAISTHLSPDALLRQLKQIEKEMGRSDKGSNKPRTIDLDIILFGDRVVDIDELKIPHPRMHLRSFVLKPLSELNPDLPHPTLGRSVRELKNRLKGQDFSPDISMPRLVSIAGVIGVGKTTLAKKLADEMGFQIVCEPYDTNPFMRKVYHGSNDLALDSQLYFLMHRADQLCRKKLTSSDSIITDYLFDKDPIYAELTLSTDQLDIYNRLYPRVTQTIFQPCLVIFLKDTAAACLDRIHSRNREYEQGISLDFLQKLEVAYDELFGNWKKTPVITLDASKFDSFNENDITGLVKETNFYLAGYGRK